MFFFHFSLFLFFFSFFLFCHMGRFFLMLSGFNLLERANANLVLYLAVWEGPS